MPCSHLHNEHSHSHATGDDNQVEEVGLAGGDHLRDQTSPALAQPNMAETQANQRTLKRATAFVLVFFVVEVIGGLWAGSLAIVSDAAHLLADVSGFILAMIANEIASRPACNKLTYGPGRAEVLSALFSTVTILVLSLLLVYSAVVRLVEFSRGHGEEIDGRMMSFIALLGLLVNVALLGIFGHEHEGHDHSHGHSHSHDDGDDYDDHDDHNRVHRGHHHDDQEQGLAGSKVGGAGVGERAPLVDSVNSSWSSSSSSPANGVALAAPSGYRDISSSNESSMTGGAGGGGPGGQDKYGSLVVGHGATTAGAAAVAGRRGGVGVTGLPELGAAGQESGAVEVTNKKEKNINMEAAMLHAVTDLVQSAGVLLAGLLIWYDPRWRWADPIATLFFVGLVVNSTRWLLQRAFNVLLEGVPDSIDYDQLRQRLSEIEGRTVVSAHIKATNPENALASAHEVCEVMGVGHSTIQVQVDHCLPANCKHPCVSAVGSCCRPEDMGGEGFGSPRGALSLPPPPSREAS